ncbi:MAG: Ig domain-containing protein [Oscillospiraceae bacterium]|nr:Ig domain-containing protein [Oscillospiraceae bacterium]
MSVYSVTVYPSSTTIKTGAWYYGAYAVVNACSNCCRDVEWYSDTPNVATVNPIMGYIYGMNPGTAKIYARSKIDSSKKDYITVTVTSGSICVECVQLNKTSISLEKGDCFTLTATVCPTNATNKAIHWRSTNESVATVSGGVVTAKASGETYIYAEATDGSGVYGSCYVRVTENILVSSVTVDPPEKTMVVGETYCLREVVCPPNATDPRVVWESSNNCVVTVNPASGMVYAQGVGQAVVTATPLDGGADPGECLLTVNPPIAVTCVQVSPTSLTMNVGDTETLFETVFPANATNKQVIWRSSNENVAHVNAFTGVVVANMAGEATITATTVDGGYTASCTVTVKIERVTIQKDGPFNKVIFESSGKVWLCINHDLIFDEDNRNNSILKERSDRNIYTHYSEEWPPMHDTTPKEYTDDEIKLLYAIDPYGVADYVKRYADKEFYDKNGLASTLAYKDRIFRLFFGRDPKYYVRTLDGVWDETTDTSVLSRVVSESEELFGLHPVYDLTTLVDFICAAVDIGCILFGSIIQSNIIPLEEKQKEIIKKIVKIVVRIVSTGEAVVRNDLASFAGDSLLEDSIENTNLEWAYNIVSFSGSLAQLANSIVATPNYHEEILNYCAYDTGYDVFIELENGTKHQIDDICEAINN